MSSNAELLSLRAGEHGLILNFTHDASHLLVGAQTHKPGMPQVTLRRPIDKLNSPTSAGSATGISSSFQPSGPHPSGHPFLREGWQKGTFRFPSP